VYISKDNTKGYRCIFSEPDTVIYQRMCDGNMLPKKRVISIILRDLGSLKLLMGNYT
jgi:hypothetical protein